MTDVNGNIAEKREESRVQEPLSIFQHSNQYCYYYYYYHTHNYIKIKDRIYLLRCEDVRNVRLIVPLV